MGYRTNGESGAAVVLIHGFGVSSYQFRENLEALGANHRVFALDLVGFGWIGEVKVYLPSLKPMNGASSDHFVSTGAHLGA